MTQGIFQEYVTSCLWASISSGKLGRFCSLGSKITFLPAFPPCSPSSAQQLHPRGETQDSRELHWAPKNPGLHLQRPGFTHTSSSRQASCPSQMAEKHPTHVGRTGAQLGDTLPPHWLPCPAPSRAVASGLGVCHRMDLNSRAQNGKQAPGK